MRAREATKKMMAALIPAVILTINAGWACAQTAMASLNGTVIDETRAVVPNVRITIINNSTSFQRQATTNDEGYFTIPLLPPGTYALTAEMPGFSTVTVNDLILEVSINSTVNIVLLPEEIAESIDVLTSSSIVADRNRIDLTSATTKYSVSSKQVASLPVLTSTFGRNTLGVLPLIVPGATVSSQLGFTELSLQTNPLSLFDDRGLQASRFGDQISINGSRPFSISFTLDGGDNNDHELHQAASPLPNPDALQELTVITGSYQADMGRSSGGIINAATRHGTNSYRGNVRHFLANEALNARGFFAPERFRDRLNTSGGQLGGPINIPKLFKGKDRAFFFLDYEGTRRSQGTALILVRVPTARERAGDFSHLPTDLWPIDPRTGAAFDGGIIPSERIDPISRVYLERFVPLPDDGEQGARQSRRDEFQNDQITLRLDSKAGAASNLSLTFFYNLSNVQESSSDSRAGSKTDTRVENQNLILRETRVLSTRTVNQITAALTRSISSTQSRGIGTAGVHPSDLGFTGIHPNRFPSAPAVFVSGTGASFSVNGAQETLNAKTTWQIKDDLSHTVCDHALRFGAEARGFLQNSSSTGDNGTFFFSSSFLDDFGTGNSFADFLLGIPGEYFQSSGGARYPRQRAYYFYAMDDWRIRSNLTFNTGLRYELAPPLVDKLDQASVFRPGQRSERFPNAPEGLLFVDDPDPIFGRAPRGTYLTDKNNFAPRLAIAYSPRAAEGWAGRVFGREKMSVRAAWGIFYDQTYGLSFTQLSLTEPFRLTQRLSSSQIQAAGGSFRNPFGSLPNPFPLDPNRLVFAARPSIRPFDPTFRTAYSYHYNLTIQRELPWSLLLEIGYVGNNSFKLSRERELNLAAVSPGATLFNIEERRRYKRFSNIVSQESTGRARFDSLQLRLARRSARLTFDGSYVYGKSIDNGSGPLPLISDESLRRGRSSFDRRHNFVVSYSYSFPDVKLWRVGKVLLNGWQVAGITELRSGLPLEIHQNRDTTLTGAGSFGSPDIVGPLVRLDPRKQQTFTFGRFRLRGHFFFDPRAFLPVSVTSDRDARSGNLGRNVFDGPGIHLWSVSLARRFRLTESQSLMLRSEVRNLFNRPVFLLSQSNLDVDSPLFGQVTSSTSGRNIQISLRYSF